MRSTPRRYTDRPVSKTTEVEEDAFNDVGRSHHETMFPARNERARNANEQQQEKTQMATTADIRQRESANVDEYPEPWRRFLNERNRCES